MSFPIALRVVLNGTRDYVQGSQIVARAIEQMAPMGAQSLVSAGFHQITDRLVTLTDSPSEVAEDNLGELTVRTHEGDKLRAYLVAQDETAPRDTRPQRVQCTKTSQSGPLDAEFSITAISDLEDIFDALVQSVKGLHEDLADDVEDVWFTSLRGKSFPLASDAIPSAGTLAVDYKRIMKSEDRWQTLMGFSISDPAGDAVFSGALTFAFKSEVKPDVD